MCYPVHLSAPRCIGLIRLQSAVLEPVRIVLVACRTTGHAFDAWPFEAYEMTDSKVYVFSKVHEIVYLYTAILMLTNMPQLTDTPRSCSASQLQATPCAEKGLFRDPRRRSTLSSSYTHGGEQHLLLGSSELRKTSHDLSGTSGAKRMAQGDGSTTRVHLGPVKTQLVTAVNSHGSKGFVNLNDVEIGEGKVVDGEQLGDGDARADTHDAGGQAGNGVADVLGKDGLAKLDGGGTLHQNYRGG